jgi:2-amino-4-hydroxy-6-hydroxymethyldihydropteridine diphosphokinase
MPGYFLAVGSNIGDREANLKRAVRELAAADVRTVQSASVYSTEPKEILDQPWFLNTVIEVRTSMEPDDLMRRCLEIEAECGRQRIQPGGPRTLDIDIILSGDRILRSDLVEIPHPRYAKRRFVMVPLAEIAPDVMDPILKVSMAHILASLEDPGEVHRTGPPLV